MQKRLLFLRHSAPVQMLFQCIWGKLLAYFSMVIYNVKHIIYVYLLGTYLKIVVCNRKMLTYCTSILRMYDQRCLSCIYPSSNVAYMLLHDPRYFWVLINSAVPEITLEQQKDMQTELLKLFFCVLVSC